MRRSVVKRMHYIGMQLILEFDSSCLIQVEWDGGAWAAADERRRRVHADATLAASAAHMAGPLITSKHLQVTLSLMH